MKLWEKKGKSLASRRLSPTRAAFPPSPGAERLRQEARLHLCQSVLYVPCWSLRAEGGGPRPLHSCRICDRAENVVTQQMRAGLLTLRCWDSEGKQGAGSKSGFLASTRLPRALVLQEARLPCPPLDAKSRDRSGNCSSGGENCRAGARERRPQSRSKCTGASRQGRDEVCATLTPQTTAPFDTPERSGSATPSPRPSWVQLSGGQLASEAAAPRGRQEGSVIRRAEGEGRRGEPLTGSPLTDGLLHWACRQVSELQREDKWGPGQRAGKSCWSSAAGFIRHGVPETARSTGRRNGGEKWDAGDWLEKQTPICPEIPGRICLVACGWVPPREKLFSLPLQEVQVLPSLVNK